MHTRLLKKGRGRYVLVGMMLLALLLDALAPVAAQAPASTTWAYIPLAFKPPAPPESAPALAPIANDDLDNRYRVVWSAVDAAERYTLQQASASDFSDAVMVYSGAALAWDSPALTPGVRYYRVRGENGGGAGPWSAPQNATLYPLFAGLSLRWDGVGLIRGSEILDQGYHETRVFAAAPAPGVVSCTVTTWYDPNPAELDPETWVESYVAATGDYTAPGLVGWQWGYPWFMSYDFVPEHGAVALIDGQEFAISGPFSGTSAGKPVLYWEFVNRQPITMWSEGDWSQIIPAGQAFLRFDAGPSRLLLHSDIARVYYYRGQPTSDTIQYIVGLSASNSIPAASALPRPAAQSSGLMDSARGALRPSPGATMR